MPSEQDAGTVARHIDIDGLRAAAESLAALADDIERRRRLEQEATEPCAICGDPTTIEVGMTLGGVKVGEPTPYCEGCAPEGRHVF